MNRSFVVVLLVALLLLGSVAVSASEPKATPNWYALRQDMEMFKGALKSIMDDVANAYLPGYGVVFLCECSFKGVDEIKPKLERALIFITPTIVSLPAGERDHFWAAPHSLIELTYVSKAGTSANLKHGRTST